MLIKFSIDLLSIIFLSPIMHQSHLRQKERERKKEREREISMRYRITQEYSRYEKNGCNFKKRLVCFGFGKSTVN